MGRFNSCAAVIAAGAVAALAPISSLHAADAESRSGWTPGFTIAPYAWIAGVDGTVGSPSNQIDPGGGLNLPRRVDITSDNELDEIGFMTYAEWRGDRWYTSLDFVWFDVSQDGTAAIGQILPSSTAEAEIEGNIYQFDVGYRLTDWEHSSMALYGGVRYYDVDVTLTLQGGILPNPLQSSSTDTWADAVIGARWSHDFNNRWNFFALTDIGFGDSDTSWQIFGAFGYAFHWGALELGYRYLSVDYSTADYIIDIDLSGPIFGAAFHFK